MVEIPKYLANFEPDLKDHKKPIRGYENGSVGARLALKQLARHPGVILKIWSMDS